MCKAQLKLMEWVQIAERPVISANPGLVGLHSVMVCCVLRYVGELLRLVTCVEKWRARVREGESDLNL